MNKLIIFCVMIALVYSSHISIPYEFWHCGTESVKKQAKEMAETSCSNYTIALNHCCAVHDDCYTRQDGKDNCDAQFCDCFEKNSDEICKNEFTTLACAAVEIFGLPAYSAAAKREPRNKKILISPGLEALDTKYRQLYDVCPGNVITISSCAFAYNLCANGTNTNICRENLANCLEAINSTNTKCVRLLKFISDSLRLENVIVVVSDIVDEDALDIDFMKTQKNSNRENDDAAQLFVVLIIFGMVLFVICAGINNFDEENQGIIPADIAPRAIVVNPNKY
ncbi:unnamed protein product [Caenorhabditis bovis]|uniref:Uncharacterized protein n=1 Tax=Caenorhabditis bovis TaxID=2654633 RepID=A0A8S1EBQ8_9PELO|nr:unnamed protein product [Caenorhabditis bovis]